MNENTWRLSNFTLRILSVRVFTNTPQHPTTTPLSLGTKSAKQYVKNVETGGPYSRDIHQNIENVPVIRIIIKRLVMIDLTTSFLTVVLKYNLCLQADNSVSAGVEKVTRITVHCKSKKILAEANPASSCNK